jgi:hypothetical protein
VRQDSHSVNKGRGSEEPGYCSNSQSVGTRY